MSLAVSEHERERGGTRRRAASACGRQSALLVSELFPPAVGGSAVLFQEIYSRLTDIEVVVLTDREAVPAGAAVSGSGPTIVRGPIAARRWGIVPPAALLHHLRVATRIRTLSRQAHAPFLVHCGRALPEGLAALLCRRLGGPPYVCWTHGEDIATAASSRELIFLTKQVYRGARAAVANSANTGRLLQALGVPDAKIQVVYPGVDADRFHPDIDGRPVRQRLSASPASMLLLSVGRLQRRKGHDLAIEAVAALGHDVPDLRYVIVGDGEERPRLEALTARLGIQHRVTFAGIVGGDELPAYYAACDVFLMPNRVDHGDIEGFGIVFLEAAATAKPTIGGRSGGVAEAVADGVTGLLVGGTDVGELASAIRTLAQSYLLRRGMGEAGRRRVLESFTWERAAADVSKLHERLTRPFRAAGATS